MIIPRKQHDHEHYPLLIYLLLLLLLLLSIPERPGLRWSCTLQPQGIGVHIVISADLRVLGVASAEAWAKGVSK